MDIKMGVRTFTEEDAASARPLVKTAEDGHVGSGPAVAPIATDRRLLRRFALRCFTGTSRTCVWCDTRGS